MTTLIIVIALFAVLGFLIGRWWIAAVAVATAALYHGGIAAGWWGYGLGEVWWFGLLVLATAGIVAAAFGIAVRRILRGDIELVR